MPFCIVVHAIIPVRREKLGLGQAWEGCHHFALHLQYSCFDVSYLYLCNVFFYLHTRLELCILFFNITELFLSMENM